MSTVIVSTRIDEPSSESLDALCARLERSRAWVLSKALAVYVEEQTEFLDALQEGVDDLDNGRSLNHDDVFRALEGATRSQAGRLRSVRWANAAQADLDEIVDYYAEIDRGLSEVVIARIERSPGPLVAHPLAGAEVGAFGLRKWSVKRTSYVLVYRAVADGIEIARVFHAKRNWLALVD